MWHSAFVVANEQSENEDTSDSSAIDCKCLAQVDHAVCLFARGEMPGKWNVLDYFALVELKLNTSSCFTFFRNKYGGHVSHESIYLNRNHAALGRAITHTHEYVYLYHARRGKLTGRSHLPLAVVAARKELNDKPGAKTNRKKPAKLRWVKGQLRSPEVCGNHFYASVQSFGGFFESDSHEEKISLENALSVYLGTMLVGLNVALEVRHELTAGPLPSPNPPSGMHLTLGKRRISELDYCACPIKGANAIQGIEKGSWKIGQGDLFKGKLNVRNIVKDHKPIIVFSKELDEANVIVKVSSASAHNLLVKPVETRNALMDILFSRRLKSLANEIGTVLYAVLDTEAGMVSVMADLKMQGYKALKPMECQDNLAMLWGGFCELVTNVLLPMADIAKAVHPDIRPGFDETSNILWKLDSNTNKPILKLIDYESILSFKRWVTVGNDGRFIYRDRNWDATTFVWWQCVSVGYTWCKKLIMSNVEQSNRISDLQKQLLRGSKDIGQWNELSGYARQATISAECVIKTLDTMEIFLLH